MYEACRDEMRRVHHYGLAGEGPAGGGQLYLSGGESGIQDVGLHVDVVSPVDDDSLCQGEI